MENIHQLSIIKGKCLFLSQFLVSQSRSSITHIDNSTIHKACRKQQMLHHLVVCMGIGTQARPLTETPVHTQFSYPFAGAVGCQPMNHIIRRVVSPFPVFNACIGWTGP